MTDIRDAEPQPPDDSGGYCCVSAGMHEGHDEDCLQARLNLAIHHLREVEEERDNLLDATLALHKALEEADAMLDITTRRGMDNLLRAETLASVLACVPDHDRDRAWDRYAAAIAATQEEK